MRLSVSVMMAGYDKRGSSEDHIRRKEGDGEGSAGKEAEGSQLNPNDLAKLRKVFILPVKDVSLKLKRAWKMTKAQQGLACVVCGKPLSNLKVAQTHVQNKSHQLKQKEHQLLEYLPTIPKLSTSYFCALSSFLTRVFNQHSAQAQLNDRHKIANRLEHYLKEDGLDATVCLFGSSGSGFALTSSNVNLSVSTAGTSGNQSVIAGCMRSVAVSLKKRGDVCNCRSMYSCQLLVVSLATKIDIYICVCTKENRNRQEVPCIDVCAWLSCAFTYVQCVLCLGGSSFRSACVCERIR
jgi:hypothetical protein